MKQCLLQNGKKEIWYESEKLLGKLNLVLLKRAKLRSNRPEVFLRKGVLKICSKFTGEHTCRNMMSIKLLCNFTKIALWHGCSPVFSEQLLLKTIDEVS